MARRNAEKKKRFRNMTLGPALVLIFGLHICQIGLAASIQDKLVSQVDLTTTSTSTYIEMVRHTIFSGVIGLTSTIAAFHHLMVWRPESKAAYLATALVDLSLAFLALGYSAKDIAYGRNHTKPHPKTLKAINAFTIIIASLKLCKLIILQTPYFSTFYISSNNNTNNDSGGEN